MGRCEHEDVEKRIVLKEESTGQDAKLCPLAIICQEPAASVPAMVLKLEQISESPEGLVKTQMLRLSPQSF